MGAGETKAHLAMKYFKSPINLYVIWHPDFSSANPSSVEYGGLAYAEFIYSKFCRDVEPSSREGVGIPIYFRCRCAHNGMPLGIDFHESERTILVVLAESNMANDETFRNYISTLASSQSSTARMFFFSMDSFGSGVDPSQDQRLFAPIYQIIHTESALQFKHRCREIEGILVHELCRSLLDREPSYQVSGAGQERGAGPIKLVLSYSREDGHAIAKVLRMHILSNIKLSTFLEYGEVCRSVELSHGQENGFDMNTALLVIDTDAHTSSGAWEEDVVEAKRSGASVVFVDDVRDVDERSFPYSGNVASVRWKQNPHDILFLALQQILKQRFVKMHLDNLKDVLELEENRYVIFTLGRMPELFHFSSLKELVSERQSVLVLYPDPPLGKVEFQIMSGIRENWVWATPTTFNGFHSESQVSCF